jgi:hypothetical protein
MAEFSVSLSALAMTMPPTDAPGAQVPAPPPYHKAVVHYLKAEEHDLWNWFSSSKARAEQADAIRLELLKTTYRIEPDTQPRLHAAAADARARYDLSVPVTFYQAQTGNGMNASLAYLPGEVHIVLCGPVLNALNDGELRALLGHEMAHFLLYDRFEGEYFAATELLAALTNDTAAAPVHLETARLFDLYTEVFADRGALAVTGDPTAAITTLIKLETGLSAVSAESYLRQAEEIFSKSRPHADQLTHPESYIRAHALQLWAERGANAGPEIERMIEGPLALDRLDLLKQQRVAETTRRLLSLFLAPGWLQSEPVLAHARLFFGDFAAGQGQPEVTELADEIRNSDAALRDYYCYVLLDFVAVDRELADTALAAALVLARRLDLADRLVEIAPRELNIGKKLFAKIEREAEVVAARAAEVTVKT